MCTIRSGSVNGAERNSSASTMPKTVMFKPMPMARIAIANEEKTGARLRRRSAYLMSWSSSDTCYLRRLARLYCR